MKSSLLILLVVSWMHGMAQLYTPSGGVSVSGNPSTGNVGVGVINPQQKLDVSGGGRFTGGKVSQSGSIENDNNASFENSHLQGFGLYSKGGGSGKYSFHFLNQSGTTILYGNSNIGIRTSAPQHTLDVSGDVNISNGLDVLGETNLTGGRLSVNNDLNNNNSVAFHNSSAYGFGLYSQGGGGGRYSFHFLNQAGVSILYGSSNIGVGTINPQYKLDVNGNAYVGDGLDVQDGINLTSGRLSVNTNLDENNSAAFYNNSATGFGLFSQGGGGGKYVFHFLNRDGNSILYGSSNGKIGIGTQNPDHLLTVNGSVHSKEVVVDLNIPVPDYVFEDTYKLPTLTEVESYIKENKHLPEVPSAKQMEAEGLKLMEMNLLLLKKVEELTLYLIEQNQQLKNQNGLNQSQAEEIKVLKSEIENLKSRLKN